jgi:hypothetical protein
MNDGFNLHPTLQQARRMAMPNFATSLRGNLAAFSYVVATIHK